MVSLCNLPLCVNSILDGMTTNCAHKGDTVAALGIWCRVNSAGVSNGTYDIRFFSKYHLCFFIGCPYIVIETDEVCYNNFCCFLKNLH